MGLLEGSDIKDLRGHAIPRNAVVSTIARSWECGCARVTAGFVLKNAVVSMPVVPGNAVVLQPLSSQDSPANASALTDQRLKLSDMIRKWPRGDLMQAYSRDTANSPFTLNCRPTW